MRYLILLLLAALAGSATAAEAFRTGPLIEGYGPAIPVADKDVPVDTARQYRLVFDAAAGAEDADSLNREFESVARFMNMQAMNGVPAKNLDLAVVVHGAALSAVLSNDAYRQRFGRDNPSLELIQKLAAAGVGIYVCGQSMGFRDITKGELSDVAKVGLSAMTLLTTHQIDGYALIP